MWLFINHVRTKTFETKRLLLVMVESHSSATANQPSPFSKYALEIFKDSAHFQLIVLLEGIYLP